MSLRVRLVAAVALGAGLFAIPPAHAIGQELLPNRSFEQGTNTTSTQGVDQPLLPVGWSFEGAAGLFDHTAHDHHTGRYAAGISAPASGKRRVCADQPVGCHDDGPVNTLKDTAADKAMSVPPAWRPQNAISVSPGTVYEVNGWYTWSFATALDGGALVRVRWLDANGVGIKTVLAFQGPNPSASIVAMPWTYFAGRVTAPAGAVKAVPLFGSMDDAWNSNMAYDDVGFHTP
jgi:hypothetical protein